MSEQEVMTPEEARDLQQKLQELARELTPSQRNYLGKVLAHGAESEEVEGYMLSTFGAQLQGAGLYSTVWYCNTINCDTVHSPGCSTKDPTYGCHTCTCPPCPVS